VLCIIDFGRTGSFDESVLSFVEPSEVINGFEKYLSHIHRIKGNSVIPCLAQRTRSIQNSFAHMQMISSQNLVMDPLSIDGHVRNLIRLNWHESRYIMKYILTPRMFHDLRLTKKAIFLMGQFLRSFCINSEVLFFIFDKK